MELKAPDRNTILAILELGLSLYNESQDNLQSLSVHFRVGYGPEK